MTHLSKQTCLRNVVCFLRWSRPPNLGVTVDFVDIDGESAAGGFRLKECHGDGELECTHEALAVEKAEHVHIHEIECPCVSKHQPDLYENAEDKQLEADVIAEELDPELPVYTYWS